MEIRQEIKAKVWTVGRINKYIRSVLSEDVLLSGFFCEGEVSNLKYHSSGHIYFSLKDEQSAISCVMWRSNAQQMKFRLEEGMKLILYGAVSVYEKTGVYQIYAEFAEPLGKGSLSLAFEQLKEKLRAEGLFDSGRKRKIPAYADCVAVISSATGAVIEDIANIARRKNRRTKLLLCPSAVQGAEAAASIVEAIKMVNKHAKSDVIIIARGGGSAEDLAPFNDEALVRAVAASKIPVISAVGHQTDFTLCDFAADLRAETPSAAAEAAFYDERELLLFIDTVNKDMTVAVRDKLLDYGGELRSYRESRALRYPAKIIADKRRELSDRLTRMDRMARVRLENAGLRAAKCVSALENLSPLKVLKRGYALVYAGGSPLTSVRDASPGFELAIRLSDGILTAELKAIDTRDDAIFPAQITEGDGFNGSKSQERAEL